MELAFGNFNVSTDVFSLRELTVCIWRCEYARFCVEVFMRYIKKSIHVDACVLVQTKD